MKINLILIDDHLMILEGLNTLFSKKKHYNVIKKISSFEQVEEFLQEFIPNEKESTIALCDLSFQNNDSSIENNSEAGFEIIKKIDKANKGIKCIVYSMHDSSAFIKTAISKEVGAMGYVLKDSEPQVIFDAINSVCQDKIYIQGELANKLLNASLSTRFFTKTEKLVADFICRDFSNEQIALELKISKRTVENHISHLYDKTGTRNRTGLKIVLNGKLN